MDEGKLYRRMRRDDPWWSRSWRRPGTWVGRCIWGRRPETPPAGRPAPTGARYTSTRTYSVLKQKHKAKTQVKSLNSKLETFSAEISSQEATFFAIRCVRLKTLQLCAFTKNWSGRTVTVGEYLQLFLVVLVDEFTVFVVRAASEEPRLMLVQGRQPQVVKILPKL